MPTTEAAPVGLVPRIAPVSLDWCVTSTAPGAAADPSELDVAGEAWLPAPVPGTVAQALRDASQWTLDSPLDFDARDWWYRCVFQSGPDGLLHFDGLATIADVWLNGALLFSSENMFQQHTVDATGRLHESNDLVIAFRSLHTALARRRPRPRWKTKLVDHQQLRWIRTTLLGRIPGWSPPVAPVGPWRDIWLEHRTTGSVVDVRVSTSLEGDDGCVHFKASVAADVAASVSGELTLGGESAPLQIDRHEDVCDLTGTIRVHDPIRWWPHTHGTPYVYACAALVSVNGATARIDCGAVGFRKIEVHEDGGDFDLRINGERVFWRGACWTVPDIVTLRGEPADVAASLRQLRDAGANMVRVGGTMVYPDDGFYRTCDELGLAVWQDFMFANMDYPGEDAAFVASVRTEAAQLLRRLNRHPSVVVYCGNSEVEQQAAMTGASRAIWRSPLFSEILPHLVRAGHPEALYVPSTPCGGDVPFHAGTGLTHYYGVGAYRRPIAEVRRARVRFTPECLGFANIPEAGTVANLMGTPAAATHDPRWKRRTPRDSGAGWDFEDVRDHYLTQLFSEQAATLRAYDLTRYLDLSRVVTGEVMSQVFSEWRSAHSSCHGALIWFLKDLWPGAGWGIVDSAGVEKACYYYVRRAWQPRAVVLTDEYLDGVHAHVVNDAADPFHGQLELTLLRNGRIAVAQASLPCEVGARSVGAWGSDALFDAFYDVSHRYRFGPPADDALIATLTDADGDVISEAFHFPEATAPIRRSGAAVTATARLTAGGRYDLTILSDRLLYAAHIDTPGYRPDDNYCHIRPGRPKKIVLTPDRTAGAELAGDVEALNLDRPVSVVVVP